MAIDDVVFEFQLEQSIIITEDTLYLGIDDLETDLCHGKLLMRTVKPVAKVNRKRGLSSTRGGSVAKKKVFVCKYCDYKSNAKYMTGRHAKVQEKSVEPEVFKFCEFSSLYAFNIKRHIMRSHPKQKHKHQIHLVATCGDQRGAELLNCRSLHRVFQISLHCL